MAIFGERKELAGKAKDPVCGMVVVEEHAVGPEESADGAVWFCSVGCQAIYQQGQQEQQEGRKGTAKESEGVEA